MKNFLFLLSVTLILVWGAACKKTEVVWPETSAPGSTNKNPNNLDSVAIFNLIIPANTPQTITITEPSSYSTSYTVTFITKYSYSVSFSIYAPEDINYSHYNNSTKPPTNLVLYTDTVSGAVPPPSSTSTTIQVVLPIHLPKQYNGCIQRSVFSANQFQQITENMTVKTTHKPYSSTVTYRYVSVGGEINGSGNCESFYVGQINDTGAYHMIFSQTGTATY